MSRLSFSTMLCRINEIGDSSPDPDKSFRDLLSPTASRWGETKIGSRKMTKRKLLGRILAYTNMPTANASISGDSQQSSFVKWLMSECTSTEKSSRSQLAPCQDNGTDFVASCIEDKFINTEFTSFGDEANVLLNDIYLSTDKRSGSQPSPSVCITQDFIRSCIDNECYDVLEKSFQLRELELIKGSTGDTSTASVMLDLFSSFQDNDCFLRLLLKWIPLLLDSTKDMKTLFAVEAFPLNISLKIVCRCAMQWPIEVISKCQAWIVAQRATQLWKSPAPLKLAIRFLALSSHNMVSVQHFEHVVELSLDCVEFDAQESLSALNAHPDWLICILHIAEQGPPFLNLAIGHLLDRIDAKPHIAKVYSAVLMQLYTLHPSMTTLIEARLKTALLQGAVDHTSAWMNCRCPLDNEIKALLSNLSKAPNNSLLQATVQLCNNHPLLLLRHLNVIKEGLVRDGSGCDNSGEPLMKRGRIHGKPPGLIADISGRPVKVYIIQWGYSFNEQVWTCMMDLLLSVPAEILTKVGVQLGLSETMSVLKTLLDVQVEELNAENNIIQLRAKFNRLSSSLMSLNWT
jgi:hypothetical protein